MLFLKKSSKIFSNFASFQSKACQVPIILSVFKYASTLNRNISGSISCGACYKQECFPLDDLKNINLEHSQHNLDSWCQIVEEIWNAKENGQKLPSSLNMTNIDDLLQLESCRKRSKYLTFLFKKEKLKLSAIEKKLRKKEERQNTVSDDVLINNHIQYGLGKNTFLLTIRKHAFHKFFNRKLANSVLFGQKLVFDLGYDEYMYKKERRDCVAQLRLVHSINRKHNNPYDIYFCNALKDSYCVKYLQAEMPNIDDSMISLTEKSYLDVFPKERLVYLSPHAPETLKTYDHNAVYIIGGFVDTVKRDHISLQKSQSEGLKSYSLPLDQHVLWGAGSKSLSINQVFSIMMTLRDTGDWKEALMHIPTRKIRKLEPDTDETELVSDKLFLLKN